MTGFPVAPAALTGAASRLGTDPVTVADLLRVAAAPGLDRWQEQVRRTGGCAIAVDDDRIRAVLRDEWRDRRFAWSPEGAATLAVLEELADRRIVGAGDRVVLVNTASAEKYLPTIRDCLDGGL